MKIDMLIRFSYALDIDNLENLCRKLHANYARHYDSLVKGRNPRYSLFYNEVEKDAISQKVRLMAAEAAINNEKVPLIAKALIDDMEETL